ncbi:nuclear receptor-interacting protein 3-like protein [Corchorus olitorius]|uniref:Nuclear receptor-interacting protein 3-like protein n=1 Tax=Corchorus olitorius TaxID=93759 RepID=A0A1R3H6N8_9ROSI|nr:nuclear receptor-interacting protein 3-like protein [Corchorus olitorius]
MAAREQGINNNPQAMFADGAHMATGTPASPVPHQYPPAAFPSPSPHQPNGNGNPIYLKQQNGMNIV